jgi:galactose mutarotase-like enzyme
MGVPLLHPWANRVPARRFTALGRTVDLDRAPGRFRDDGETGLPMHGVRAAGGAWAVEAADTGSVTASFDWGADPELLAAFPFAHRVRTTVALDGQAARWTLAVEPAGDDPVPVAAGFHPYLTLPGDARGDWRLELPVRRRLVLDARKLPTGATEDVEPVASRLRDAVLDDGYDRLDGERPAFVLAGESRTITVTFETGFPCAQVYAPATEDVVAFEPMTAPTNALVTGLDLPLAPHEASFSIAVR